MGEAWEEWSKQNTFFPIIILVLPVWLTKWISLQLPQHQVCRDCLTNALAIMGFQSLIPEGTNIIPQARPLQRQAILKYLLKMHLCNALTTLCFQISNMLKVWLPNAVFIIMYNTEDHAAISMCTCPVITIQSSSWVKKHKPITKYCCKVYFPILVRFWQISWKFTQGFLYCP